MEGTEQLRKLVECAAKVCDPDPHKIRKTLRDQIVRQDTLVNTERTTR